MSTNARLRALVAVAGTGSVRAAAQDLAVTESTVSSALTALSAEIGLPLVERYGRGMRLTGAGQRYAGFARTILGLHEEALAAARDGGGTARGLVRLAAVTTAGEHVLPALLASFRHRYPDVDLAVEVAPRSKVWPMLDHHEVDLVIAGRPPESPAVQIHAIRPNDLVVVGAPALAGGTAPGTATWLMREPGSGTRQTCRALLATLDADPPVLTFGSSGAVIAAAVAGLGVTLVSRHAVTGALDDGRLVELPVPGTPLPRPWHAVTRPDPQGAVELLVRHLLADPDGGWRRPGRRAPRGASIARPAGPVPVVAPDGVPVAAGPAGIDGPAVVDGPEVPGEALAAGAISGRGDRVPAHAPY